MTEEKKEEKCEEELVVKGPNELMLCQTDAYVKRLKATVLECVVHIPNETNKKKKKKKKKEKKLYKVRLSDTILFPEGGGQPADHGTIGGQEVKHVFRDPESGLVYHVVDHPIEGVVEVVLDFTFRFDNMQHHTGQHLISALALKKFGWKTLSWSLSSDTVAIQFDASKEDWTNRASQLESTVNESIRSNVLVTAKEYTLEELQADTSLRVSSKKVPEGVTRLRIVSIGHIDSNPCCGTHVKELSHLQMIKFTGVTKRKSNSVLTFCAGDRILRAMQASLVRELQLTNALNCGPELFEKRVYAIQDNVKQMSHKLKSLSAKVSEAEATRIVQCAQKSEINFVATHYNNDWDMSGLLQVVSAVERSEVAVTFFATRSESDVSKGSGNFILIGDSEVIKVIGPQVASALNGRGGGRSGRFQGKCKSLECASDAVKLIEAYITEKQ